MQNSNTEKMHKVSKFEEGRLKLSTSCTECHRRKQKVNVTSHQEGSNSAHR